MDRKTRQNITNEITINPNNSRNQLDLISLIEHSNDRIYILLSVHETFSKTDNMLGYKTSPKNFKGMRSYKPSSPTTMEWNYKSIERNKKYVEIKNRPN